MTEPRNNSNIFPAYDFKFLNQGFGSLSQIANYSEHVLIKTSINVTTFPKSCVFLSPASNENIMLTNQEVNSLIVS